MKEQIVLLGDGTERENSARLCYVGNCVEVYMPGNHLCGTVSVIEDIVCTVLDTESPVEMPEDAEDFAAEFFLKCRSEN